jgi:enoyl-CoA hydratase
MLTIMEGYMQGLDNFKVTRDAGVALVTINRPPVNAITRALRDECIALFAELHDDAAVRSIVLTGAGKTFCAGPDMKDRPDLGTPGAYPLHNRSVRDFYQSLIECAKPIIAAINGPAIGGGFVLASCCDILVAQDSAWITMPEVDVGLAGGVKHVSRHFGQSDARLLMFTGRKVGAGELYRMGALSACVPAERLIDDALAIAREIASKSPASVQAAKSSFLLTEDLTLHSGYRYEQSQTARLAAGADHDEAMRAFAERRPPVFP